MLTTTTNYDRTASSVRTLEDRVASLEKGSPMAAERASFGALPSLGIGILIGLLGVVMRNRR